MDEDKVIVVQETEYTGAGKHILPQLSFARENGIEIKFGNPDDEVPGESIILPEHPSLIKARDVDLNKLKNSYIKNCVKNNDVEIATDDDVKFLMEDTKSDKQFVLNSLSNLNVRVY